MWKLTIGYGVALVALAVGGYFGTGAQSPTALIPAAIGVPAALCGWLAKNPKRRMAAMHVALLIALLGFLGSVGGVVGLGKLAAGVEVARPAAVVSKAIMALLSGAFLAVAIRSFVQARRSRAVAASE